MLISSLIVVGVYVGAFKISHWCLKKSNNLRLFAIFVFLILGVVFIATGYYIAFIGYIEERNGMLYQTTLPYDGIAMIALSGLFTLAGVLRTLYLKKENIE
jgi:hypothetical protein